MPAAPLDRHWHRQALLAVISSIKHSIGTTLRQREEPIIRADLSSALFPRREVLREMHTSRVRVERPVLSSRLDPRRAARQPGVRPASSNRGRFRDFCGVVLDTGGLLLMEISCRFSACFGPPRPQPQHGRHSLGQIDFSKMSIFIADGIRCTNDARLHVAL